MDFDALYAQAQNELNELSQNKAVLSSKIQALVSELGLDPNGDIRQQALDLKASTEKEMAELTSQLESVVSQLESIKTSVNESESFR